MSKRIVVFMVVLMFLALSSRVFSINDKVSIVSKPVFQVYYKIYTKDEITKTSKQQSQEDGQVKEVLEKGNPKDIEKVVFFFKLLNPPQNCQIFLEIKSKNFPYKDVFLFEKLINIFFYFDNPEFNEDVAQTVKWYFQALVTGENQYGMKFNFLEKRIPKVVTMDWSLNRNDFMELLMKYGKKNNVIKSQKIYDKNGKLKEEIVSLENELIIKVIACDEDEIIGSFFLPIQDFFTNSVQKK